MQQVRESISVHQQNINRYQQSIDQTSSSSFATSDDMYHKELQFIANQKDSYGFAYGMRGAQKLIESGGASYDKLHDAFMSNYVGTMQMPNYNREYNNKKEFINRPIVEPEVEHKEIDQVTDRARSHAVINLTNTSKIDAQKADSIKKGEELQGKVNELEERRKKPEWIGVSRNKEEKFEDN